MRRTTYLLTLLILGLTVADVEDVTAVKHEMQASRAADVSKATTLLAQKAAAMSGGQWAILNQEGDGSGYSDDLVNPAGGVGSIFGFASKAAYDPVGNKVYFAGQAHGAATGTLIQYDVASNKWTGGSVTAYSMGHSYDGNSVIPGAREFYQAGSPQDLHRYDLTTGTWSTPTPCPLGQGYGHSFEYFRERDEFLCLTLQTLVKWKRVSDSWSSVADQTVLSGLSNWYSFARYNPVHKVVMLVGGRNLNDSVNLYSHAVYKYDQNGTITRMKDSPAAISAATNYGLVSVDPVSGDYLFLNNGPLSPDGTSWGPLTFYKYDIMADQWSDLTSAVNVPQSGWLQTAGSVFGVVNTAISNYGVIMYMSGGRGGAHQSTVYLYKHASGIGTPADSTPPSVPTELSASVTATKPIVVTPPTVPAGLMANAVSSSQVNLSWNASTATVGISGYKVFQNGTQVGTVATPSYSVTGLASAATYSFTVSAYDAAGNNSAQSGTVTATTLASSGGTGTTFAQKCTQVGVLACWPFDAPSELRYGWDRNNTELNNAMIAKGYQFYSGPSRARLPGEANTYALSANSIPAIDTTMSKDGSGSLRIPIPSQSGQNASFFQDNIDKILRNPSVFVAPGSALGNVVYIQYQQRLNDMMLNTPIHGVAAIYNYALTTSGAGSTTLVAGLDLGGSPPTPFDPTWVGRQISIESGNNFVLGLYTITSYIDANHLSLDRSPTPNGAGTQGFGKVGGTPWVNFWHGTLSTSGAGSNILIAPADRPFDPAMVGHNFEIGVLYPNRNNNFIEGRYMVTGYINPTHIRLDQSPTPNGAGVKGWGDTGGLTGGWKTIINFGNAPNGASSSLLEVTMNDANQIGYPQMYGQQGYDGYPPNYNAPFVANRWQEIMIRIIVGAQNTPNSRVTWWVDGVQAGDAQTAKIGWGPNGDGDGIGQIMLTPAHTGKDPTQVTDTGYIWYDDLIVSTQPIPMAAERVGK